MRTLKTLNCMNYHVYENQTTDVWFACNGWRSLYTYSKISGSTFRHICETLIKIGEVTIVDNRTGNTLTLTII